MYPLTLRRTRRYARFAHGFGNLCPQRNGRKCGGGCIIMTIEKIENLKLSIFSTGPLSLTLALSGSSQLCAI